MTLSELKILCENKFDSESEEFVIAWMLQGSGIFVDDLKALDLPEKNVLSFFDECGIKYKIQKMNRYWISLDLVGEDNYVHEKAAS